MISKIKPDEQKANSLVKMAQITMERLEKTDMEQYPSNTLLDYYDVIHELMEALTIKDGIKISGEGAHHELIEYLAKDGKIDEQTRLFLEQMREYRNRISYEGFMIHKNYVSLNLERIKNTIHQLLEKLKNRK